MADELLQMFQSITTSDHDELVEQFAFLLELDHDTATFFLESSNWNVEVAANNYLTAMDAQESSHGSGFGHSNSNNNNHSDALHHNDLQTEDLDMDATDSSDSRAAAAAPPTAQFVSDLSESQATLFPPTAVVNMLWSFVNTSDCAWPDDTLLVFAQGEHFDGPQQIPVRAAAHERIEIRAALRLPATAGAFAGSWRLRSATSGFFGDPVWVVLHVGDSGTKANAFEPTTATVGSDNSKQHFEYVQQQTAVGTGGGSSAMGGLSNNDMEDMDL